MNRSRCCFPADRDLEITCVPRKMPRILQLRRFRFARSCFVSVDECTPYLGPMKSECFYFIKVVFFSLNFELIGSQTVVNDSQNNFTCKLLNV